MSTPTNQDNSAATLQRARLAIKAIQKRNGLSQRKIAQRLKLTGATISNLMGGRTKHLSNGVQRLIETEFGVSAEWLTTGRGEMFVETAAAAGAAPAIGGTIAERVLQIREALGLSQSAFARRANIVRTTWIFFEQGSRVPQTDHLLALWDHYGVNCHWLLTGQGHMLWRDQVRTTTRGIPPGDLAKLKELAAEAAAEIERLLGEPASGLSRQDREVLTQLQRLEPARQATIRQLLQDMAGAPHD